MILNAYAIYDRKSLVYNPPFFTHTDGSATRMLSDLVNDLQTNVGRHPSDYVLFRVGTYDDAKGLLLGVSPLVHVIDAMALVTTNQPLPLETAAA